MVYGFALARTGSRADADDVFQEVFLAYFQCGKHFREEEHRRGLAPAHHPQFQPPGDRLPLAEACGPPLGACGCAGAVPDPGTDRALVRPLLSARRLRVPLYLFYFEELSTQEIARLLSLRPGAVRMRLSRGREHLRELLKGDYFHE